MTRLLELFLFRIRTIFCNGGFDQTEDKVFIVLDHCASGDLAADIQCHRIHGRVSVGVARHFMRQLGRRSTFELIKESIWNFLDCCIDEQFDQLFPVSP